MRDLACRRSRFIEYGSGRRTCGRITQGTGKTCLRSKSLSTGCKPMSVEIEDHGNYQPAKLLPVDGGQPARASGREGHPYRRAGQRGGRGHARAHARARRESRGACRGWTTAFKRRLLDDGSRACEELGLEVPALKLLVVENTPEVHNVIVCTLCSCYPRMLLGIPPDWYKSRNYRSRMVREPRAVLAEFGLRSRSNVDDPRARFDRRHALYRAADAAGRHGGLERRAPRRARHRDCMIGVAVPKGPSD